MKNLQLLLAFLITAVFFVTSCNGNGSESSGEPTEAETEENGLVTEIPSPDEGESSGQEIYKIPPAVDTTISVEAMGNNMEEIRFSTSEIRVPSNGNIKVILENNSDDSAMVHNIVFLSKNNVELVANLGEEAGMENAFLPDHPAVFAGSELAEPGETVEMIFTAPHQSGEYAFICTYPGHWKEMNGRFIVETVAN